MSRENQRHVHVAIAGTGFGGLGMAIRLKQEGVDDFLLFERADDVGGVWRDNTYPGCACDVESHLYSFSFAPNPTWSRAFSPSHEIWRYLRDCAERFGVLPHIRFRHELKDAIWDEERQHWRLETTRGTFTADVFVSGVGALSEPSIPRLPGLERFEGRTMHSARWDHGYDLTGRKVGVVGTGASAIQFIPAIQPKVGRLNVFQRTPAWVLPRNDHAISPRMQKLFRSVPATQRLARTGIQALRELMVHGFMNPRLMRVLQWLAIRHLERTVPDPVLRAKLTPSYTIGCKRILISDDYLRSLTRPNVEVITSGIREIRPHSVVTQDGAEYEVDALIFGTGFQVTDMPVGDHVRGTGGRTLSEAWNGSPKAHAGTTVNGFPNFFMLQGPNTGLGHTSVILMIESQIEHVLGALRYLRQRNLAAVEPSAEAQSAYVAEIDRRMNGTVWVSGGCRSWYLDRTGRNSTLWPGSTNAFRRRIATFRPEEYVAHARRRSAQRISDSSTMREAADG